MPKNRSIALLNEAGQSVWYDNLSKDVLKSGELQGLIDSGVSGLTSNPTIFKKAIADSDDYDADIKRLAGNKLSDDDLCEALMVEDVRAAADLPRRHFSESRAADGYASIEVSPELALKTDSSIEAGKRIWGALDRPNIMIKIPGTAEGIPAIKALLESGINVNITLIFAVETYEQVANAYVEALETRLGRGQSISEISSVASFFISRVDAICEETFEALVKQGKASAAGKNAFFGKIAIANSKLAYQSFSRIFGSERFKRLRSKGARVQRPLWASTGVKNPQFDPLHYVRALVGADTVNTLPPATLKALLDADGPFDPKLLDDRESIMQTIAETEAAGLSLDALLRELQVAGIKSFADSYRGLVDSIKKKRTALR